MLGRTGLRSSVLSYQRFGYFVQLRHELRQVRPCGVLHGYFRQDRLGVVHIRHHVVKPILNIETNLKVHSILECL